MKTITLINPNNARRILRGDINLNYGISVVNGDSIALIIDRMGYNKKSIFFGSELRINYINRKYDRSYPYITLCLKQFDDIIELELVELEYGIALKINTVIVYYKIRNKTFDEILKYRDIKALDLSAWTDLDTLVSIKNLDNLESLILTLEYKNDSDVIENSQFDYESVKLLPNLKCLILSANYSEKIIALSSLIYLETLFLKFLDGLWDIPNRIDLSFIEDMISLKKLGTFTLGKISDVSFLNKLKKLEDLCLRCPELLKEINLCEPLSALKSIMLLSPTNLENLSFLKWVPNLEYLSVFQGFSLKSIEEIAVTSQLKLLDLSACENIQSYQSISNCKFLETLDLRGCSSEKLDIDFEKLPNLKKIDLNGSKINNLGNIFAAQNLYYLSVRGCEKLVQLTSIDKMSNLKELDATESPNIRNLDKLSLCRNLRGLRILGKLGKNDSSVYTIQILMSCAFLRCDISFIKENISKWIENIVLSKDPIIYVSRLLSCINLIKTENYQAIQQSCISIRARGLQSDVLNDLDANTWETWCDLAINLDKTGAISCLHAAINDINIEHETEVILGPVIMAAAALIEKYPEEKEPLLEWVQGQLQQLENHTKEQRQIAPSAAMFFASLNKQDDVLFWLQKATDEKAPLWRERVLHALVKYYAHKENFAEARRLLDEMQIQDVKDQAIAALAQAMAVSHPIEAGFILDEIQESTISIEAARKLIQQPSMLSAPQGIYQLLLHLQSNPDELASALEMIIERDIDGRIAEAVKQLFIQAQASGPSAAVLLELCKHPSISDFVKPRALEKYKSELQERANRELSQSIPHLIAEMQNAVLLEEDEAEELTKLMQTT
jgi:hypothetical protein